MRSVTVIQPYALKYLIKRVKEKKKQEAQQILFKRDYTSVAITQSSKEIFFSILDVLFGLSHSLPTSTFQKGKVS